MMPITLCIPPRAGELCAPIRFPLRGDSTVLEITDPETSRPVDVRFDVYGTYLGVVADEN